MPALTDADKVLRNDTGKDIANKLNAIADAIAQGGGGGSSTLAGLNDVNLTSPSNEQVLKYNSTTGKWENADESGGSGSSTVVFVVTASHPSNPTVYSIVVQAKGTTVFSKDYSCTVYGEFAETTDTFVYRDSTYTVIAQGYQATSGNKMLDFSIDDQSVSVNCSHTNSSYAASDEFNILIEKPLNASSVDYDNVSSGLEADNVQDAIDEVKEITDDLDNKLDGLTNIISTASGTIATFADGGDNIPLKSCDVAIVAQQASGTPSPSNPRAISGFDNGVVSVCGVNLFDGILEKGYISTTTGEDTTNTSGNQWRCKNYIRVKPNTSLYMKLPNGYTTNNSNITVYYYDVNKNFIGYESNKGNTVIQIPSNCYWFRFCNYIVTAIQDAPTGNSLNYPSSDTQYHAYTGTTHTITLPETIYGGTADVVNGNGSKTYVNAVHTWSEFGNRTTLGSYVRGSLTLTEGTGINTNPNDLCNIATFKASYSADEGHFYIGVSGGNTIAYVFVPTGTSEDTSIQIVYELATPTTFTFTGAKIPTLSGENNIYSNCGDVTVEYFNENSNSIAELVESYGTYIEIIGTLASGQTSITFTDSRIKMNSTIDVYTDSNVDYNSITSSEGSITIAFDAQENDLGVKVRLS